MGQILDHYLKKLHNNASNILGCTHILAITNFKNMSGIFLVLLAAGINCCYFEEQPLHHTSSSLGQSRFLVTDNLERFRNVGQTFLQKELKEVQRVELPHQLKYKYE